MIEQKQRFTHDPAQGIYGDCFRTAVACLLEVSRDDVPHVFHDGVTGPEADARMNSWLANYGLAQFQLAFPGDIGVEGVLKFCSRLGNEPEYLLAGMSKNGTNHIVVCKGDRIVWDPAIDSSGIVGPASNGCYLVVAVIVTNRVGKAALPVFQPPESATPNAACASDSTELSGEGALLPPQRQSKVRSKIAPERQHIPLQADEVCRG